MAALTVTAAQAVARTVEGLGYEFVDAERLSGGLLRVTVDKAPGTDAGDGGRGGEGVAVGLSGQGGQGGQSGEGAAGIGLEDCERVSRQLTHLFAVENVDYDRLEVSSPGLDRPLKRAQDYRRFVGSEVQVQLHQPLAAAGGRKRLQGRLLALAGDSGAEVVRLQLVDEAAQQVSAKAGAARAARARVARRTAKDVQDGVAGAIVEFALADVDKARLVPELDFRGAGRRSG